MTFVWQIRDRNTRYWIEDASSGWWRLVTQDKAWLWRKEDLAKKALAKILGRWDDARGKRWFEGFESPEIIGEDEYEMDIYKYYEEVDLYVVCSKLVPAGEKDE